MPPKTKKATPEEVSAYFRKLTMQRSPEALRSWSQKAQAAKRDPSEQARRAVNARWARQRRQEK